MTATRVITDHSELDGSGQVSHETLDSYVTSTKWIAVSGSSEALPPSARQLKAGVGISIVDSGPGNDLTISAAVTGSLPTPKNVGELLFAVTSSEFVPALPITTQNGWLVNNDGLLLVVTSSS